MLSKGSLPISYRVTRLEVEEQHYDGKQIRSLYESEHYPLTRKPSAA